MEIIEADLSRTEHQEQIRALTAAFALDPVSGNDALSQETLDRLIPGLRSIPTTAVFLAYVDGHAAGIATCFRGFSTFKGTPFINIHDLAVLYEYRGMGIGRRLLDAVERKARELGCGQVTLEVHDDNVRAKRVYDLAGYGEVRFGEQNGAMLFYAKTLVSET